MRSRLAAATAALLVLAALPGLAHAAGSKPRLGVYDCYAYEYIGNNMYSLVYKHSSKLKKDGKYEQAFARKGKKLTNPTTGNWTYKAEKKKIVFKTGAFKNIYGKWNKPDASYPNGTYTEYLKNGGGSPGTCYPQVFK